MKSLTRHLFAKITKVDEAKREVTGCIAEEAVDKDGEVMDYKASKPNFLKWNENFSDKTNGASVGNLREMHQTLAAGKFIDMEYDDDGKKIYATAKVVDDKAWEKVLEGVYTGFSIGARIVKKWPEATKAGRVLRWIADPYEASLVDNPCMYGANFEMIKADGSKSEVEFKGMPKRQKNLYTSARLAGLLDSLMCVQADMEFEREMEGDKSPSTDQLYKLLKQLSTVLISYTQEQVDELFHDESEDKTVKTVNEILEGASKDELLDIIQNATKALASKGKKDPNSTQDGSQVSKPGQQKPTQGSDIKSKDDGEEAKDDGEEAKGKKKDYKDDGEEADKDMGGKPCSKDDGEEADGDKKGKKKAAGSESELARKFTEYREATDERLDGIGKALEGIADVLSKIASQPAAPAAVKTVHNPNGSGKDEKPTPQSTLKAIHQAGGQPLIRR